MTKTIYFSGSITGGRQDVLLYQKFVAALEAAGHPVLAGVVTSGGLEATGESLGSEAIFRRDLDWLGQADLVVAEVSIPSHGVGYEIGAARYLFRIPVICLWRPARTTRCSAMLSGDVGIKLVTYTDETVDAAAEQLLAAVAEIPQ